MRKIFLILFLLITGFIYAQTPVQISQPYYFLKWIKVKDSTITNYFRIPVGAGVGKILVSDAKGYATWSVGGGASDTLYFKYCNGCAVSNGWKRSGDTVKIDTSFRSWVISQSYLKVESDPVWIGDSSNYYKKGSTDALLLQKQNNTDTTTFDATRYWVTSRGYLTTESDPIWTADSSNYYQKVKVDGMLGLKTDTTTFNDFLSRFEGDSALVWDSIFNRYTKAQVDYFLSLKADTADNATRTWVGLQGFLKTESDPIWVGDSSNYYKKGVVDNLLTLKADTSISINAGYGMLGGGNLQYDRTLSVDTTTLKNVFLSKNTNIRDSIYLKMGSINSPDGWIVDTLKLRNDYLLTESDPVWTSDSSNYAAKSYVNKMVTDTSYFDGNRTILQSGWTGVTGTNKGTGTVKDFLEAVFFPFVPATISINNTSVLNEVGSVATVYTISGATTVNSETIFSNGGVYKTYPLVDAGLYYNFGASTNYSTTFTFEPMQDSVSGANAQDVRFRSQQLVGNNGSPTTIYSSIKYLLSTYPYCYGTDSTAALISGGTAFYGAMSKLVESVGNKTVGFNTADLKYFWFAYPANYADLTSILDQNGFEQITNFTKYTVNVSSTGLSNDWSNVSYKIYRSNAKAFTVGTWNYQFIY